MPVERFAKTLVVTAGAYSANDVVGGRLQFTGCTIGTLQSITIADKAAQAVDYLLVFFESAPTDITDNATFDINDADIAKIIYHKALTSGTDRQAFTDNSFHFIYGLDIPLKGKGSDIYAFLITTGTPTYADTGDVTVTIQVETKGARAGLSAY